MSLDGLSVRLVIDPAGLAACLAVRREVFIEEQGISEDDEVDGRDGQCRHILASLTGRPVGAARLMPLGTRLKVQRVAVLKSHRGRKIGEAIMRFSIDEARRAPGVNSVILGAQTHALAFYERLGFVPEGPVYDDAGVPHRDMRLSL